MTDTHDALLGIVTLRDLFGPRCAQRAGLVRQHDCLQGIVSSVALAERTGQPLRIRHRATSFADVVHAINHPDETT